ncbi:MAG TPA: ABC transporter substrate-binding protein [Candidatus Binatia bacterium]|jgi:ABC-type nitrate/sulfonate/bicarbonate transport system substrate-binding protein
MRRLFSIALLSIGFFTAPAARAAQITLIWTSETGTFAPIWVTKEARLFEKYGNQVQLVFIQGAAAAAAAIISNDAQIGSFSPQVVLTSAMQGLDLTMVGRLGNSMDNRIFGRRGVTDIKQVKSLAISRFASNADFAGRYLVERAGLKPDTDVAFLQFGNQTNRISAIETGRADAAIVTPPITLQAKKMGFPLLIDSSKLGIPYSSLFFTVRKSYLVQHREDMKNVLKAIIEGVHYFKAHKDFSFKVIAKNMHLSDPEVVEETFREYEFPLKPYPSKEYYALPIQEVGRKDPRILKENPDRFADMTLIKELDDSGFIDKLTKEYKVK